jgi:hypothetical protein
MGGKAETTQQTQQQSQLTPWSATLGKLQGILSGLDPSIANINGTPQINQAFGQLEANAQNPNPLGPAAINAATTQLGGGANYGNATGILNSSYGNAMGALSPYASGDAYSSPALAQMRATIGQDVANQVNPMFAAAGRLGSPDNYQALARGITQGETPLLQGAAQNQIQAGGMLGNLGTATASGLNASDVANAGIQSQGIGNAATAYGAQNLGPQALLSALLSQQQMPIQNAQALAGILGPLAGMFGQQTGNSSSQGTQEKSTLDNIYGGINAFANLAGALNPYKKT